MSPTLTKVIHKYKIIINLNNTTCQKHIKNNYRYISIAKPNQMHNVSNLFYFVTTLYMFRAVFPSIIRSLRLYIQHHIIQVLWLLASKQPQSLCMTYT